MIQSIGSTCARRSPELGSRRRRSTSPSSGELRGKVSAPSIRCLDLLGRPAEVARQPTTAPLAVRDIWDVEARTPVHSARGMGRKRSPSPTVPAPERANPHRKQRRTTIGAVTRSTQRLSISNRFGHSHTSAAP